MCVVPPCMCFHGGEHVLSLFFSNLSKIKPIQVSSIFFALFALSLTDKIFSCLFSSAVGSIMCLVLVQAMEYTLSSLLNPAISTMKKIGLLYDMRTRIATWFYAMHRALRMKPALKATIHNPSFASLSKYD